MALANGWQIGPDVSSWQHGSGIKGPRNENWHHKDAKMSYVPIDWNAVKNSGNDFAIFKATQGTGYTNPYMPKDSDDAKAAGLVALYYHFAENTDPVAEANYFLSKVAPIMVGEGLALDQENQNGDVEGFSFAFMDHIRQTVGFDPFIYLNLFFSNNWNWSRDTSFPGWFASYSRDPMVGPSMGYWGNNYAMQQYTDNAIIPGISGPVDRNVFFGTRDQLLAMCKKGVPVPPPTPPPPPPSTVTIPGTWKAFVSKVPTSEGWILTGIGTDGNMYESFYRNSTGQWENTYLVGRVNWG